MMRLMMLTWLKDSSRQYPKSNSEEPEAAELAHKGNIKNRKHQVLSIRTEGREKSMKVRKLKECRIIRPR